MLNKEVNRGVARLVGTVPYIEGDCSMMIGSRFQKQGTVVWTEERAVNQWGFCDFDVEGRWFRANMAMTGQGWDHAEGFNLRSRPRGRT